MRRWIDGIQNDIRIVDVNEQMVGIDIYGNSG